MSAAPNVSREMWGFELPDLSDNGQFDNIVTRFRMNA